MLNIYEQVDSNKTKSAIIMVLFVVFIAGAAWIMAQALGYGLDVVGLALVISGLISFASYYWSDKIILNLSGARPASRKKDFHFYTVTENLCLAAQIPLPKLYVIDDTAMNAFATGRDPQHAVVVATTGILAKLDRTELEGVIAHELSHVRNYDIRLMSIVTILVGLVTLLADWMVRASYFGGSRRDRDSNTGNVGSLIMLIGFALALLSPISIMRE